MRQLKVEVDSRQMCHEISTSILFAPVKLTEKKAKASTLSNHLTHCTTTTISAIACTTHCFN